MRRFELWFLMISAVAACPASAVVGWLNLALASFGCFYTAPIGGAKCSHMSSSPFWAGFWDTLGLLSLPWTLVLIFFVANNRRRTQ